MLEAVLAMYGREFAGLDWHPAGGGFSGAAVFAGSGLDEPEPRFALKRLPRGKARFLIAQAQSFQNLLSAELDCVPELIENRSGCTVCDFGNEFWELSEWRPGAPLFALSQRLITATAQIIAALHRIAPAIRDPRLNPVTIRAKYVNDSVAACAELAFDSLPAPLRTQCLELRGLLQSAPAPTPIPESECLSTLIHGDLHAGHILFTGDDVTGIIDFASAKIDHPAVDVARYFGETAPDAQALVGAVSAYRTAGGDSGVTLELVQFINGVIRRGAAAHWLKRFAGNEIPPEMIPAVSERLTAVLRRLRAEH